MSKLFVVEALRWGDDENHSYIVGIFEKKQAAIYAGEIEETWRGGKYKCRTTEHTLGYIDKKQRAYHEQCKG